MDRVAIGYLAITAGLGLIALRVPIGVALGVVSFFGIAAILNMTAAWGIVTAVPFNFVGDWNLTAIPMFLLMGYVASSTGLSRGLFRAMRIALSRLPGGLAVASVGACALLSAASGSSVATSSAFARIATPEMLRYRYDPGLASGVVAAAGTLGSMIPPSILMVLYGYVAEISIAKLFMAGFLPGLLTAAAFAAMIIVRVMLKPSLAPPVDEQFTRQEKLDALAEIWPLPVLIIAVLVGIFVGVFTPTEAGAVGAFLAILLAWARGMLSLAALKDGVLNTLTGTAGIFMVVIGTVLLARLMALSGVPGHIAGGLMAMGGKPAHRHHDGVGALPHSRLLPRFDRYPAADAADHPSRRPAGRDRPDLFRHHPREAAGDRAGHAAGRPQRLCDEGRAREPRLTADDLPRRLLVRRDRYRHAGDPDRLPDHLPPPPWHDGVTP